MNSRNHIQRELEQISSRLPFDVRMPVFDLPQGYFENFAAGVLAKIKGEPATAAEELSGLSPLLAGLSKKSPYTLPENYFEEAFLSGTAGEDPIPGWNAEGRPTPYTVPAGYFSTMPQLVLNQVAPKAKVIPMFPRKWMAYAAAAVLTGALVLGGILYNGGKGTSSDGEPSAWIEKKLHDVSNQELEAFILATGLTGNETVQQAGNSKGEIKKLLKDVPNSELDAFLNGLPSSTGQIN